MNEAHWHLAVNHLPIIFPIVGVIVMITGMISKSEHVKRTAYLIFVIGALAAIAAMNTGEGAEEIAEKLPGVTHEIIENHEETAETFAFLCYALGALSLIGAWASLKQKSFSGVAAIATLVFALVVIFFGRQTGTTGGEVRHTEIRDGFNVSTSDSSEVPDED